GWEMSEGPWMNRRGFLRGVIGVGMVGGVGVLVFREHEARGDCVKRIGCVECEAFGRCELARAKGNREALTPALSRSTGRGSITEYRVGGKDLRPLSGVRR
ncbi:MAG: hypothetical protein NTU53_02330, partial [Planctomycetota bacterium]|nr:hypothetical protein [Planctomycetota bacterium]